MKRLICTVLAALLLSAPAYAIETLNDDAIEISSPSAVLTEKVTGEVIYEKNSHERIPPASVTKVMTLLLIIEAIDRGDISLEDAVIASARAASFGGSCVFLEEGEKMSVHEMLKCIAVVSANDCAVAMAEHLCGSEQAFVQKMNERAAQLGLKDTHFCNCTGLFEDPEHYSSAYDIAVMSRELIKHELIKDYTTIWMDSIRNGEFGLSNTNKLVYYYEGCTGLKTGFTDEAMYCLSATAERDGVEFIAVIMHGETIEARNDDAKALLNYGFANCKLCPLRSPDVLPPVSVTLGSADSVQPVYDGPEAALIAKNGAGEISYSLELPESVEAPVAQGQRIGTLKVILNGETFREVPLLAGSSVESADFGGVLLHLLKGFVGLK
ncbi:MAG: D-alanyl-D-alanine carboxypeptidase [Oscillospiraceae bacterium]|nr:D-alanyl-D-alanine carboxypeptidase [Oscillospiraceae bacterium]